MRLIKEFDHFKDNPSKTRTKKLTEEEFLFLLKENCKNFSFDNDQLFRGNPLEIDLGLYIPERRPKGISFPDYFSQLENDPLKYPVIRSKGLIGLGGGENSEMIRACGMLGKVNNNNVYQVIPFDNSKLIFCPVLDLELLKRKQVKLPVKGIANSNMRNTHDRFLSDDIFTLVEYHKNFKFPIEDVERIKNRINATMSPDKMGYEFFTSSPCLMIKQKKIQWLKDLL